MVERPEMTLREKALSEDLAKEYYALVGLIDGGDGRVMIVKGWSVTLSFAALGLGFQQQHYALFGLAALTAAAFWYLDGVMKGHQMRHYSRMRDIEVTAYELNTVELPEMGTASAPRIDMYWAYKGASKGPEVAEGETFEGKERHTDWRRDRPERRKPKDIRARQWQRFVFPNVMLPHVVAIVVGGVLFLAAAAGWQALAIIRL